MTDARYPIGPFEWGQVYSDDELEPFIQTIANGPRILTELVQPLTDEQLDSPYREDGWTIRQLVHHIADSHLNAYTRFRLALTEDVPTIKPYDQEEWALLEDAQLAPAQTSLLLLQALTERWVQLLRSREASDFNRTYYHPENDQEVSLREVLAHYAWHTSHHIAHIEHAIEQEGWELPAVSSYIIGLGGIFFKSPQPETLKEWYQEHFGLPTDQYGYMFTWRDALSPLRIGHTQWSIFPDTGAYMEPGKKDFMLNYRVQNMQKLLQVLTSKGVEIIGEPQSYEYGTFAWVMDPDGNKIELWEPVDTVFTPES